MKRVLALTATVGAMGLALGFTATQANAAPGNGAVAVAKSGSSSGKNYTCSNQGGGPNHKVTCIGTINGNNVTVNVGDINILSGNDLTLLQNVLNDVTVKVANLDVNTQIKSIKTAVLNFYVGSINIPITLDRIQVCIAAKCG